MRAWLALTALAASTYAALSPRELLDVASHSARLELAADGSPIFHILRKDELIDTDHDGILAQRLSHVAIKVALDPPAKALRVGDQLISLTSAEEQPVQVVKTDALVLPEMEGNAQINEQQVAALAQVMSPGIVSLEVRVESEPMVASTVTIEEMGAEPSKQVDWQLRRIGVFVKIIEVEGLNMAHSSVIYAPLLQLIVKTDAGENIIAIQHLASGEGIGAMPGHVETQALPPFEEAAKMLPAGFRPVPTAEEMPEPPTHSAGVLGWLASMFGREQPRARRPCPKKFRQGLALAGARHDEGEGEMRLQRMPGDSISEMPLDGEKSHHRHHHHYHGHRRRRGSCFFRRAMRAARKVYEAVTSTAMGQLGFNIFVFGASFSITRRILRFREARRARRLQLAAFNDDQEIDEKQVLFVDELPSYQQAVPEPVVIVVEEVKTPDLE